MWHRSWYNIHHVIWKSQESWANVRSTENQIIVNKAKHDALNTLIEDNQHPQAQLWVLNDKRWNKQLSDEAQDLVDRLLEMPKDKFYRAEFIKRIKNVLLSDQTIQWNSETI